MARLTPTVIWLLAAIAGMKAPLAHAAPVPKVVADIAPVHSLVEQVMDGVGKPKLLLSPGTSPHDYSMRPSEARMLEEAEIVVWTGPALTPWLPDTLAGLTPDAEQITFSALDGLTLLPFRDDARFEPGDHDADEDNDHGQGTDPHIWLDPRNAAVLVTEMARVLSEHDPVNAAHYKSNAQAALDGLAALESDINAVVAPLRSRSYLVFHDAYHYFEARFAIPAAGAVSVSDAAKPGARRMRALQRLIAEQDIVCVFAEPQFEPKLLRALIENTAAKAGILDPVGAGIEQGAGHYQDLLRGMAGNLAECLTP